MLVFIDESGDPERKIKRQALRDLHGYFDQPAGRDARQALGHHLSRHFAQTE